ncbi:MAG TPA: FAD-dependent oxidoreductase [Bacillota bacterium]
MMEFYQEPARAIPIRADVEVLVVGAGPAGFSAAVNAARNGARTMLLEQSGSVGGVATSGQMSHWTGSTRGGFYEELLERANDFADGRVQFEHCPARQVINPEKLKTVMLEMLHEAGVMLQLYTFVCEPILEGERITGVVTESKSGREAIKAGIVIDASGDGDIAARAGVPFYKGRESDGKMQPMTLMFKVAGVDTERAVFPGGFEETYQVPAGDLQTLGRRNLPFPAGHVLLYRTSLPGVVTCNMTNCIDVDGTSVTDLTRADYFCRLQLDRIVDFLHTYVPGFEQCYLISSGAMIGVRETRHFQGEYTLTEQDILNARVFDDWAVTKAHFNFDIHNLSGSGLDETGCQKKFGQPEGYTIPYRSLVPLKIDNLLLAGRNISGTHLAHSNFRVMPICVNMGQAAGTAAALCIQDRLSPRRLDVGKLQERLRMHGVEP